MQKKISYKDFKQLGFRNAHNLYIKTLKFGDEIVKNAHELIEISKGMEKTIAEQEDIIDMLNDRLCKYIEKYGSMASEKG